MSLSLTDLLPAAKPAPLSVPGLSQAVMAPTVVRYCAVAIYLVGKAEPTWLHAGGKIVVFDTKANAQDVIELLAEGRQTRWDISGEKAYYEPLTSVRGKINRALIVTEYDIFNLPAGHATRSETRGKAWRYHVHWGHWLRDIEGVS